MVFSVEGIINASIFQSNLITHILGQMQRQHEKVTCNLHIDYPSVNCINAAQATSNTGTYGKNLHSQGHTYIQPIQHFGMS